MVVGVRIIHDQCHFFIGNFEMGQTEIEFNNGRGAQIAMGSTRQSTLDRVEYLFVYLQPHTNKTLAHGDTRTRIAVSSHDLVDTKVGQVVDTHVSHFPPRPAAPCRESGLAQLQCERVSRITGLFPVGKLPCQQIFSCQFFFTVHITRAPSRCCPGMPPWRARPMRY